MLDVCWEQATHETSNKIETNRDWWQSTKQDVKQDRTPTVTTRVLPLAERGTRPAVESSHSRSFPKDTFESIRDWTSESVINVRKPSSRR